MYVSYYLAVGSWDNWQSAFRKGNIWGLADNRYRTWSRIERGDVLFFYVEAPACAVVGRGVVLSTYHDSKPFFAEDWGTESEWPWRISFEIAWPDGDPTRGPRVTVNDLQLTLHRGFQELPFRKSQELLKRCSQA